LSYGRRLGIEKGFNLAQEVGFIGGACSIWQQMELKEPGSMPPRALRAVKKLCQLVADFPLADPNDESIEVGTTFYMPVSSSSACED